MKVVCIQEGQHEERSEYWYYGAEDITEEEVRKYIKEAKAIDNKTLKEFLADINVKHRLWYDIIDAVSKGRLKGITVDIFIDLEEE